MGFFDSIINFIPGYGLGEGLGPTNTPTSTLTPEQQQLLQDLIGGYYDESGNFTGMQGSNIIQDSTYSPTAAPTNQYAGQMGGALQTLLSGQPAYNIDRNTTEQYYRQNIYDPAMQEYEDVTRPGFLESLGSLHSGTRANLERTSRQDLAQNLSQQRSNLYYQDEQARRQSLENARQMQLAGLGAGTQMRSQDLAQWQATNQFGLGASQLNLATQQAQLGESQIPMQQLLALLGLPANENIVTQPSPLGGIIGNIPGVGGGFGNYF